MVVESPSSVMASRKTPSAELEQLDLGYLALFVGLRTNELVSAHLEAAGRTGLRSSHGYIFQHLLAGPVAVTALARQLGVSQQAASKSVAELRELGYLEEGAASDARVRLVTLSSRGHAAIAATRAFRKKLERTLHRRYGREFEHSRALLASVLADMGGAEAVRTRTLRAPR